MNQMNLGDGVAGHSCIGENDSSCSQMTWQHVHITTKELLSIVVACVVWDICVEAATSNVFVTMQR